MIRLAERGEDVVLAMVRCGSVRAKITYLQDTCCSNVIERYGKREKEGESARKTERQIYRNRERREERRAWNK